MRIRTIKPDFWQSSSMASVSRDARLVAIALLNYADDDGYFLADIKVFKGALFPFDDDLDIPGAFRELSGSGYVAFTELSGNSHVAVTHRSGKSVGMVVNFKAHQRINKPQKSRFNVENAVFGPFRDDSATVHAPVTHQAHTVPTPVTERSDTVPTPFTHHSVTEVEVERDVEVEREKEKLSLPPRAREPEPAPTASAWGKPRPSPNPIQRPQTPAPKSEPADDLRTPPEDAQAARRERWSKRRKAWLDERGEPVDFTVQPGPLTWLSYCKAVHPSWQDGPARKAYDTLATYGWKQGGRRIESWWQVADAWAENSDHAEHYEKLPIGSMVAGTGLSEAMSAAAAGITGGEGFS